MTINFTNGSSNLSRIDWAAFDGVVAGYFLSIWEHEPPTIFSIPDKIYRSPFLYGNKHHIPHPDSGCETLVDWVKWKVGQFPQMNEWVLVNEFTDDLGICYPNYSLDDLKRYCEAAYLANPNAKLIIGEFKPHLLKKWEKVANICQSLKSEGYPIEVGIQTHIKTYNAPVILARLPEILGMFDSSIPTHIIEVSLWHKGIDKVLCGGLWAELLAIANNHQVKSFCPWWLYRDDANLGRRMPTFEGLTLYSPISQ